MRVVALPAEQHRARTVSRARSYVQRYWRTTLILVAVWTFFAVVFTPQSYIMARPGQQSLWRAFAESLIAFEPWIVISPLVLWAAGRFPLVRGQWLRNFALQLLLSIPVCFAHVLLIRLLFRVVFARQLAPFHMTLLVAGAFDLFVYWSIAAAGQGLRYYREYEEREYRLTQAQLQMLKGQLQPHFLFNTLNAVTELVYRQPETADRVLTSLSDLLRMSLRETAAEVRLRDDLQFVYKYMEIQKELLRDRLSVEYDIDPRALNAAVPAMMLQPLLENAVKHGLADRASGGSVRVNARVEDTWLKLEVEDDGAGAPRRTPDANGGIGLANTRTRLAQLYGDDHSFEAGAGTAGGFCVSIKIPCRELPG